MHWNEKKRSKHEEAKQQYSQFYRLCDQEDAMKQEGVKALILCNPSNPCGKVFTREELQTIANLAIKYDIYVITDEVYEHIVYAPSQHTYMASLPGMRERTIVCSSLSKTIIRAWCVFILQRGMRR